MDAKYVIKAQILDISKPRIWRRFVMNDGDTFAQLHQKLQEEFRWLDYHLHLYEYCPSGRCSGVYSTPVLRISDRYYRKSSPFIDDSCGLQEEEIELRDILPLLPQGLVYLYDLGDKWRVSITLEKKIWEFESEAEDAEVRFHKRRGAPPPEDCGGTMRFQTRRDALLAYRAGKEVDPQLLESAIFGLGPNFDPNDPQTEMPARIAGLYKNDDEDDEDD